MKRVLSLFIIVCMMLSLLVELAYIRVLLTEIRDLIPVEATSSTFREPVLEESIDIVEEDPIEIEEELPVVERAYNECEPCSTTSSFKSYMDYRMITNRNTKQWDIQEDAYTGDDGMRYYGDRLIVAMAQYPVGTEIDIVLHSGDVIEAVIGDIKAGTDCAHPDGSILEFIVDTDRIDPLAKRMGDFDTVYKGSVSMMKVYI